MNQIGTWSLQVGILATGIYLFLRFLRTTRGSGVLRGLLVAFVVGVLGLWGVAEYLELEELQYMIQGVTPYLAVILVILFQPELRRAIAQLGEQERFGALLGGRRHGTVHEVVQAALDMAARRHGALIAFQREVPLDNYTQAAVRVDSDVRKSLLETIFHPGSALHDGGVVIGEDRIVAAACIFPLTENTELSKTTGTRHRAALGLTEETDAVTLIVSEETGSIAVCQRGQIDRHVAPDQVENLLLERLGARREDKHDERKPTGHHIGRFFEQLLRSLRALFTQDLLRKGAAIVVACLVMLYTYQEITVFETLDFQVVHSQPGSQQALQPQQLEIRLPGEGFHLVEPSDRSLVRIELSGTRATVDNFRAALRGVLKLGDDIPEGSMELPLEDIDWSPGGAQGLDFAWIDEPTPRLLIARFDRVSMDLGPENLEIDTTRLDSRLEALVDEVTLVPKTIEVRGPSDKIRALAQGEFPLRLEPLRLGPNDVGELVQNVRLSDDLRAREISIADGGRVTVTLEIIPAARTLQPPIETEIDIVPGHGEEVSLDLSEWSIFQSEEVARFRIETAGIIPAAAQPGQQAFAEQANLIREYVESNLTVFVRIADLDVDQGSTVPVRSPWPPSGWRAELERRLGQPISEFARLELVRETEDRVRLVHHEDGD